jgi:uncharacterized protein (TIGR03086 family)
MTTNALTLMPTAAHDFSDRVHQVGDAWDADTPDDEWDVRALVNHVTVEQLWVPHLLRGETVQQVGDRYDGDQLGEDPVEAWDRAIEEALSSWADTSPDEIVHLSFGDFPAVEYADQMLLDLVVHGWDLARGVRLEDRMNPDVVAHALAFARKNGDLLSGSGLFGTPLGAKSDDPQDQLLALCGREREA